MATSDFVAAGWYPNPDNAAQVRYWDGSAWTTQVRDAVAPAGVGTAVPMAGTATVAGFGADTPGLQPVRRKRTGAIIGVAVGVVVLLGAGAFGVISSGILSSTVKEETYQGVVSLNVPKDWRNVNEAVLPLVEDFSGEFAGAWTADNKSFFAANDYLLGFEYAGVIDSQDYTVEELGEIYFSGWLEDFDLSTDESESLTTKEGYEAWRREVAFTDPDGVSGTAVQYVVREGTSEFSIILYRYDDLTGYEDQFAAMINTMEFLDS